MIVAEFSMVPMGSGTSAGDYIKAIHHILGEAEVNFIPGPMSTAVEAKSLQELFDLMEKANDKLVQMGLKDNHHYKNRHAPGQGDLHAVKAVQGEIGQQLSCFEPRCCSSGR